MLENIQIPEPINNMPDVNPARHFKKWAILVGIPLLIIAIIVVVYISSQTPRLSASQTIANNQSKSESSQNQDTQNTKNNEEENSKKEFLTNLVSQNQSKLNKLNDQLYKYDSLFTDVKITGQCYSSGLENIKAHDIWQEELKNGLLEEISYDDLSELDLKDQETLKTQQKNFQNYKTEIAKFLIIEQRAYDNWFKLKSAVFKICDESIDKITTNCKDVPTLANNLKDSISSDTNADLYSASDSITTYCNSIDEVLKTDNETRFNELNKSFSESYAKLFANHPNLKNRLIIIKEL